MKSPPNAATIPGRELALLSPDATFPSPDDKEDDGGALVGTSRCTDYQSADGIAVVVKTGVLTYRPWRYLMVPLGHSSENKPPPPKIPAVPLGGRRRRNGR